MGDSSTTNDGVAERSTTEPAAEWPSLGPAASRLGAYRWAEIRLFELTGAWASADGASPSSRIHFFEMSAQHGWHAELWGDRLPVLAGVDQDALTQPAGSTIVRMFEALEVAARPEGPEGSVVEIAALAVLYRVVLPHLVAGYRAHLEEAVPVAEGPTRRALLLVQRDEEEELVAGRSLLDELAASADASVIEAADRSVAGAFEAIEADHERQAGDGWLPGR